jgi:glycosyltransferase involved in cell wall biosynthesis
MKDKIKILFVMFQMGMGGSERLVYNLALMLNKNIFSPSICWFVGKDVLNEFKDLNIPLYHVIKKKRFDFTAMHEIHRIVKANDIDLICAQHFMPAVYSFYAAKVKNNKSLVFTAHSKWEIDDIPFRWKILGGYLLKQMDSCVGVTKEVALSIKNKFGTDPNKTLSILNGVNIDIFDRVKNLEKIKQNLGFPASDILIGMVANFKEVKNHMFLLQAFNQLVKSMKGVKLVLVGKGFEGDADNTEHQLKKYILDNNLRESVVLLGYRSDIPHLMRIFDILCLVSLKEGLPISIIEAMAARLPIIGTNVEGIRDIITSNQDGILVELGDQISLKNALLMLLKNQEMRTMFGKAGREKVEKSYSLQQCVYEYEKLFISTMK